jgi:hypothetical protein
MTMRDLRSALSWMLLRDHGCIDVAKLLARTDGRLADHLAWLYYYEAFADSVSSSPLAKVPQIRGEIQDARISDRLVSKLREADIGLVNSPALDRRLDHSPLDAVPWMTFEGRSNDGPNVLFELWNSTPTSDDELSLVDVMRGRRKMLARLRRWAFFERRDEGWERQLPYQSSKILEDVIERQPGSERDAACERLRDGVVDAISLSEGLRNSAMSKESLALRITRVKNAKVRSYRIFPKDSFKVHVPIPLGQIEYLEYAADVVELVSEGGLGHASLRISLDLLEMLELIRSGYRPTTADLQGLFVNLLIFRNELLATHFDRLLVTPDDEAFFEIQAAAGADGINLKISPRNIALGLG